MAQFGVNTISTGSKCIDQILGNGVLRSQITLIYGAPNTGKTTLAIQCAVASARKGLKTIFVDSDNTFSTVRLTQIALSDINLLSPLIFVIKPRTFHEQSLLFENLEKYLTKGVGLVVVDTINSLYRNEMESIEKIYALNRELNRQLAYLNEAAKKYNIAILILSQVHDVVKDENSPRIIEPLTMRVLKFWAQNILDFNNTPKKSVRESIVKKNSNPSKLNRCYFKIVNNGIISLKE